MTTIKCRAKNPAKCRVHGNFNVFATITNSHLAAKNLNDAKNNVDLASNLEELSEAKQLLKNDQKVYDSTLIGLSELKSVLSNPLKLSEITLAEKVELERRYEEATTYRNTILTTSPKLENVYSYYDETVEDHAIDSNKVPANLEQKKQLIQKLSKIAYGTPVVIKTKSGAILYDGAGDGLLPNDEKKKRYSFLVRPRGFIHGEPEDASISLKNSSINIPLNEVDEIHIMEKDTSTRSPFFKEDKTKTSPFWQVEGEGYSYFFEGEKADDTRWQEHKNSLLHLEPYKPKLINQVSL